MIKVYSRCLDCGYFRNLAPGVNVCEHGITDKHVFKPRGVTDCSSWSKKEKKV